MSAGTWVLVALCAAGVLLAAGALIPVVRSAMRVSRRLDQIKKSPLALSVQSLQIQSDRLRRLSTEVQPLLSRAQIATGSIRASLDALQMRQIRKSLVSTKVEIEALRRDLQ